MQKIKFNIALCFMGAGIFSNPIAGYAFVDEKKFDNRQGFVCEPDLLDRRIAEATGGHKRFLEAIDANAVDVHTNGGVCSGTFITNQCVLTAAHCLDRQNDPSISVIHPITRQKLINGTGHQFTGYSYINEDQDKVYHNDKGDTAVVRFQDKWKGFKPLRVWYFKHNRDFWFYNWNEKRDSKLSEKSFNRKFWSDFGVLGLTAVAPLSVTQPRLRARCSDENFGWAPHPRAAVRTHAWDFAVDRVSYSGMSGPGMSGGAVYDMFGILGTIESSSRNEFGTGKELRKIEGTSFRLGDKSDRRPGHGSNFTMIKLEQAKFINSLCPGANLKPRFQLKGGRVAEESNRDDIGYVGSVDNRWDKLSFSKRQTHVSRSMKSGDKGLFVERLQKQLKRLGYYNKKLTSSFDSHTANAVRRFQFDKNLKETGVADIWTLKTMGIMIN